MAYASLVSLSQTTDKLLQERYPISLHEKQQAIVSIHEDTIFLQSFLEDVPKNPNTFEERVRDLANKAEDIIEDFISKQINQSSESSTAAPEDVVELSQHRSRMCVFFKREKMGIRENKDEGSRMFMCFRGERRGIHGNKDEDELQQVAEEIKSIAREAMEIKNSFGANEVQISDFSASNSSSRPALTRKDTIVGFEDDLLALKDRLCGESKLQIIPIFGMGGIGKTTLAENAYDDRLIVEHFHIRAWVTVSQDYNAREILSSLLDSMKVEISEQGRSESQMKEIEISERVSESQIKETIYRSLKGRRFLVVMDDIWSTEMWDDVKMIFPNDYNGSRIMLTTRLSNVAVYPGSSSYLHEMQFMDADESWKLLKRKVFPQENCPIELETIGKDIARSCRGLPLAIVLIAGLLTTVNKTHASWENIARNVNQAVCSTHDEQFEKRVLSLSYNHLSHHLRPCFLYMGNFPEDYEIRVSKLIKIWVAEGFVKPSESKSFEELAEEYLEDLVNRSLVLVIDRKANGKIKSCGLHDLLRDLCIRKAQEEKFHLNVMDTYIPEEVRTGMKNHRRVTIAHSDLDFLKDIDGSTIRTIMCFQFGGSSLGFLGNFRLLRVLDVLYGKEFFSFPTEVFHLFHLRFLALCYHMEIPAAISKLENLQTLIIYSRARWKNFPFEVSLPSEIWRMPQLRHLVSFFDLLPDPEGATFTLENLRTISEVMDFICNETILKMIPNIKKLGISYVGDDEYVDNYHLDNLVYLHQLENLKLKIYDGFQGKLNPVFPKSLKTVVLSGLRLPWKDMGIVGSLPILEVLKLKHHACVGDKWETTEGEYQGLRFLLIEESNLQQWITESSHFPNLTCLVLYDCWKLNEIPNDIGEIPTLELIQVDWKESLLKSAKRIQEEQENNGNDALQVRGGRC